MARFLVALLALVLAAAGSLNAANVQLNTPPSGWKAGDTVTISWTFDSSASGPAAGTPGTLNLMRVNGDPNNMQLVSTIGAVTAADGSLKYTVPSDLANGSDYALQYSWADSSKDTFRYTGPFAVTGGTGSVISNSATTSSGTATTTGSSTATSATSTSTTSSSTSTTATPTTTSSASTSSTVSSSTTSATPKTSPAPTLLNSSAADVRAAPAGGVVAAVFMAAAAFVY
ncbi:hypothetical protein AMAG_16038 [Allomyces macrogynus ATCC 38327]|uniref:Yeast cell wall synthesis Kre9/Knh1-like N-terminal domain-containing protein n=1 Tax=Allomyces macrogynus (strain ATCC 38327) TaxID=578462 RepID=A0A0L0TAE4_ALLM3|nr:hypothetical protein AMAG_16038 [Allomyces macrogynus ATCC 38327]|eukprot:KNE71732.1 hypothetical protein AMAG_16038 [Allomyces macrogynus ATCC 38327]